MTERDVVALARQLGLMREENRRLRVAVVEALGLIEPWGVTTKAIDHAVGLLRDALGADR